MQSPVPANSNINGSAERHQIGRNGSFWMPEKMAASKPVSRNFVETLSQSSDLVSIKQTSEKSPSPSSERGVPSRTKPFNKTPPSPVGKNSNQDSLFRGVRETTLPTNQMALANVTSTPVGQPATIASHSVPLALVRDASPYLFPTKISRANSHKKSFSNESGNKLANSSNILDTMSDSGDFNSDRGTESASRYMLSASNTLNFLNLASESFDDKQLSESPLAKVLINFFGNKVLPKISFTKISDKEVFRFALDLPNGKTLGVRLQNENHKSTLCFISPNLDSDNLIQKIGRCLEKTLSNRGKKFDLHHFKSFSHMDSHFKNYSQ